MGNVSDKCELVAELCHQINSPLAAMRNALYLASERTQDPAALHYLALANDEITAVALILNETRVLVESMTAASRGREDEYLLPPKAAFAARAPGKVA